MAAPPSEGARRRAALAGAVALAVAGCATLPPQQPLPSLRTVTGIESGVALLDNLRTVGVVDTGAMNAASRVHLRRFGCWPDGSAAAAACTYETDHCLSGYFAALPDGWCRRTRRYVRAVADSQDPASADGWKAIVR
jgi:hypothetical protein